MSHQVLLIDDSVMLHRIAAGVLHAQSPCYEVVAATRASEGFAKACTGDTALILVDERIVRTSAADFYHRLLNEPRTTTIPVVLLTGRQGDAPSLQALPENVVETLGKPFTPEQLASLVNAITALTRKGTSLRDMRLALRADAETGQTALPPERTSQPEERPVPPPPVGATSIRATLQAVVATGQTGVLRFCPPHGIPTEVLLESGRLILITTRDGASYSQAAAGVLPAKVSLATLQEAADEQSRTGVPFLLTLGARGLVSKSGAVDLLWRFGQRYFARLWTLPVGSLRIEFEPLEALPGFTLRLEPMRESVDDWLLATVRLLTVAGTASAACHQGLVGTPRLTRGGETILKSLKLSDAEHKFVQHVTGHHDLPAIAQSLGLTTEKAFLMLYRFQCLEALEYRPAPLPFMVTPRTNLRRVLPLHR